MKLARDEICHVTYTKRRDRSSTEVVLTRRSCVEEENIRSTAGVITLARDRSIRLTRLLNMEMNFRISRKRVKPYPTERKQTRE